MIRNKLVPIGNSFDKHTATLEKKLEEYSKQSSENLSSDVNPTVTIVFLLLVLVLNAFFFIKLSNQSLQEYAFLQKHPTDSVTEILHRKWDI